MNNDNCKYYKWLFLSIFLALLDIGSKYWIKMSLLLNEVLYILPGINFYYIHNSGLAFGLFSNIRNRWMLVWIMILTIVICVVMLHNSIHRCIYCYNLSYSMIIGGALGNLYDRVLYGTVVDFIDFYIGKWHWPIFNIADIEICVGIFILLISNYYDL